MNEWVLGAALVVVLILAAVSEWRHGRIVIPPAPPPHIVGHLKCPECGQEIPVSVGDLELHTDDEGQQRITIDLQTDDVWAHNWSHREGSP